MPNYNKPTLAQVKSIHFTFIKFAKQEYLALPKMKEHLIQSILDGVDQFVFGQELYPTLCDKAIYILKNLESSQSFPDGNKRVALATSEMFLKMNKSVVTKTTQKEKEIFMLGIANKKITTEQAIQCCIKGLKD